MATPGEPSVRPLAPIGHFAAARAPPAAPAVPAGPPAELGPRLTRRQDDILHEAARLGYYDLPRRVHLRDIAKRLGTSVASLAEVLRRAEGRLVADYVRRALPPNDTPPRSARRGPGGKG